jgi:hypothetical protein
MSEENVSAAELLQSVEGLSRDEAIAVLLAEHLAQNAEINRRLSKLEFLVEDLRLDQRAKKGFRMW